MGACQKRKKEDAVQGGREAGGAVRIGGPSQFVDIMQSVYREGAGNFVKHVLNKGSHFHFHPGHIGGGRQ